MTDQPRRRVRDRRAVTTHGPAIFAAVAAAVGCLAPASAIQAGGNYPPWLAALFSVLLWDKALHFVGFAILGFLVYRSIRLSGVRSPIVVTAILVMAYATLLELLQGFVASRTVEMEDLAANLTGVLLSVGLGGIGDSLRS